MPIRTVFFDMGGTIETFWFSPEMRLRATPELQRLMLSHGIDLKLSDEQLYKLVIDGLASYHHCRLRTLIELPTRVVWSDYILADYPSIFGDLDAIAEDLMLWVETHYYCRQMRPEVPSVLNAIQQMGYKIGLISNVSSRGQVPLSLSQYGIKQYFNPIVLSSEYGRRKPDPAIFHYAARLSNCPTSECIYIGDRISRDVFGAKRAGFNQAIQINHDFNHGESDEGATPDRIISNLNEFLELLEKEYQAGKRLRQEADVRKIKAVLFDADGILYYRKSKGLELSSFIKQHRSSCKDNLGPEINQFRHQTFIGKLTFEQYMSAVLSLYGITDPNLVAQGINVALMEKEKIHFFRGEAETLKKLKARGLYLGIVTNTAQPLHVKINKLERGKIGNLWDSITPSNEVGVQKPNAKIYLLALEQLGVRADQAVFVGHNSTELQGAREVGITTIAFNYDRDARADFYIEKFTDLANLAVVN